MGVKKATIEPIKFGKKKRKPVKQELIARVKSVGCGSAGFCVELEGPSEMTGHYPILNDFEFPVEDHEKWFHAIGSAVKVTVEFPSGLKDWRKHAKQEVVSARGEKLR